MTTTGNSGAQIVAGLIAFGLQIPATIYVVATGTAPTWTRWTLGVFAGLYTLLTLIKANKGTA